MDKLSKSVGSWPPPRHYAAHNLDAPRGGPRACAVACRRQRRALYSHALARDAEIQQGAGETFPAQFGVICRSLNPAWPYALESLGILVFLQGRMMFVALKELIFWGVKFGRWSVERVLWMFGQGTLYIL